MPESLVIFWFLRNRQIVERQLSPNGRHGRWPLPNATGAGRYITPRGPLRQNKACTIEPLLYPAAAAGPVLGLAGGYAVLTLGRVKEGLQDYLCRNGVLHGLSLLAGKPRGSQQLLSGKG